MVACTNVDGAEAVVPWARSLGSPTPHARIATDPVLPWDLAATERHVAGLLAVDAIRRAEVARVRLEALPVSRYTSRVHVEPAPLRQVGVVGDLAAALAELDEREAVAEELADVEVAVGGRCDEALVWEEDSYEDQDSDRVSLEQRQPARVAQPTHRTVLPRAADQVRALAV